MRPYASAPKLARRLASSSPSAGASLPILARDVQGLKSLGSQTAEFATQIVKQGLQGMIGFSRAIEIHGAHQVRGEFNAAQGSGTTSRADGVGQELLVIQP